MLLAFIKSRPTKDKKTFFEAENFRAENSRPKDSQVPCFQEEIAENSHDDAPPSFLLNLASSRLECEHRFIKKLRTLISAKTATALLAGAAASQGLNPIRRAQRPRQKQRWIQHPWYDERCRGVILKSREMKGFLHSGMARN